MNCTNLECAKNNTLANELCDKCHVQALELQVDEFNKILESVHSVNAQLLRRCDEYEKDFENLIKANASQSDEILKLESRVRELELEIEKLRPRPTSQFGDPKGS